MREWVVRSDIQYRTGQGVSGCCEAVETRFDRSNIGVTFSTDRASRKLLSQRQSVLTTCINGPASV